ncbi:hypothetical protein Agub_g962 [Astrephomene gubernaculifera]|uniref:Uncharacterized protein n=1 Tax=Astrephomene gubernaculifera TaxID=47775 RepID=A0AAD3DEL9_9CHLO|nr:hypothetical protein Agub_g962 [Astrephomene gubernaculifera]
MALSARSSPLQRSGSGPLPSAPALRLTRRTSGQLPHPPLSRACSCPAAPEDIGVPSTTGVSSVDPFLAAGRRLQTLLSRVGDGEDEMLDSLVEQESPESKLQTSVILGGCMTMGAVLLSSFLGQDPWGGVAPSLETLHAAGIGAAVALPLTALRLWTWTPAAAKALPALQDVHAGQLEVHRPWLSCMGRGQVLTMMALEVLPATMLLFPAGQAAIMAAVAMYGHLISGAGMESGSQETYLTALALVLTAAASGVGRSLDLSVSDEEYETVQAAAQNADRYYRTVAADVHTSPADASRAAEAFRFVAQAWLQTRGEASLLAGLLSAVDVLLLGALWHGTGNLAAPAVAALALNAVDYWQLHSSVLGREAKVAQGGSGGGAGGK